MSAGLGLGHAIQLPVCDTCVDVKIATQPANTTADTGAAASFTVTPSGTAPFTYQWERSTDNGATWSPILGATSITLNLPAVEYEWDGYLYRVSVENCGATVVSASAELTVNFTPLALSPTLWLDSTSGAATQEWTNLGSGGSVLNARNGSSAGPDTNDALLLDRTTENYVYLPGVASNGIVVAGSPALRITGDLDLRVHVALDDWTPSAGATLIGKSNNTAATQSFILNVQTSGVLRLLVTDSALAARTFTSSVAPSVADGSPLWIRATLDVDNGAGGSTTTFYTSTDGAAWTQLGATVTIAATFTINPALTTGVTVGAYQIAGQVPAAGKFYRAQVLSGIGGTVALDIDFTTGIVNGAQTSLAISGTAADQLDNALVLTNLGTGGPLLNAQRGSNATAADTNDPQVLTHTGTNYLYLTGVSGNYASTPDSAALDITGDIGLMSRVAPDDWTPTTDQFLVGKYSDTSNQRSYGLGLMTSGVLRFYWSPDGVNVNVTDSTVAVPYADGAPCWVYATMDVDDGAGNRVLKFYSAPDSAGVPGVWTQLGTTVTTAGTASFFVSTALVEVGTNTNGVSNRFIGKVYRAIIVNGYDGAGTVVFDADFTTGITSGAQATFTESSVNAATVTINRSTSGRKAVAVVQPTLLFGTDDYMEVADNALLNFGATDSFTVMTAARVWATPVSSRYVSKYSNSGAGWQLRNNGALQSAVFAAYDGAAFAFGISTSSSSGDLRTFTGVRNTATDEIVTYMDGTAGTPVADTTTLSLSNTLPLTIGRRSGVGTEYADMEFFGAAIWRRALSAAEITTVSNHYAGTVTPASLALLGEAVFWVDAARSKQAAVIARSTSGRKSVAVVKPVYLFGTDDFMEIADNALLDFDAADSFSLIAVGRYWATQGTHDSLLAKKANTTDTTQGWSLTNGSVTALNGQTQIGDGVAGVTATSPSRGTGPLVTVTMVRDVVTDQVTVYTDTTAGTSVTDTTTGTLANSEVVRIGRLSGAGTEYVDAELVAVLVVRAALTPAQVSLLSNYYRTLFP